MNNKLIDTVHEEIDRLASMMEIASIEFNIFCSKFKLDAKVKTVKPFVDAIFGRSLMVIRIIW